MMGAASALLLALAAFAQEMVSVLPLAIEFDSNFRVGRKASGMLCAPAGSWYWRDVRAEASALKRGVEAVLAERGMAAPRSIGSEFGEPEPLGDLRLRGRVTALAMSGCVPWKPTARLVGGQKVRGKGRVTIVWELYSNSERAIRWSREIVSDFDYQNVPSMAAALEKGVSANAAALMRDWPR